MRLWLAILLLAGAATRNAAALKLVDAPHELVDAPHELVIVPRA